ncbi:MAG: exo-beta-N-acetylmuramidase NamZ domain-containing protein [Polyangiales bacterium]
MTRVRTGLDRIADGDVDALRLVAGRKLGLLAHAASVDQSLRSANWVLHQAGARVSALFGPEHGFAGAAQDMVGVGSRDAAEVPVYSLYGDDAADLSPNPDWLRDLDAIVIDLQDVGSRYYTYVWTAALTMKVAASVGTEVVVLDRPNPLGGARVEGAPQRDGYLSFVGLYPVSVRHGLSIAELMGWVREREGIDEDVLQVVPMQGWTRAMSWNETGLPWVMPSPNMPTLDTAAVYPGGCLVEGTLLSEGRGTTRPFEIWGAPDLDVGPLLDLDLHGVTLRPVELTPTFQKHAGRSCSGVQVHITDPWVFRPYETYLRMLAAVLPQLPPEARWRTEEYEFVTDRPAIDLLTGGPEFRLAVDQGAPIDDLLANEARGAAKFDDERRDAWLYEK